MPSQLKICPVFSIQATTTNKLDKSGPVKLNHDLMQTLSYMQARVGWKLSVLKSFGNQFTVKHRAAHERRFDNLQTSQKYLFELVKELTRVRKLKLIAARCISNTKFTKDPSGL